jgi:hypothetical protein
MLLEEGILAAGSSVFIFPLTAESWKLPYVFNSSLAAESRQLVAESLTHPEG